MSRICPSHGTHMNESDSQRNESRHTYERDMSHIWKCCSVHTETHYNTLQHTATLCRAYAPVMAHIRMSHVTQRNDSRGTYKRDMSRICLSHATHTNESCHTKEGLTWHI